MPEHSPRVRENRLFVLNTMLLALEAALRDFADDPKLAPGVRYVTAALSAFTDDLLAEMEAVGDRIDALRKENDLRRRLGDGVEI